jgi:hypothetical protein
MPNFDRIAEDLATWTTNRENELATKRRKKRKKSLPPRSWRLVVAIHCCSILPSYQ